MKRLTDQQAAILGFIRAFIEANQYPPSVRDIAEGFGITPRAAHDHLDALVKKEAIHREKGKARAIVPIM